MIGKAAWALIGAAVWLAAGGGRALAHQQTTTFAEVVYPDPGPDGADLTWRVRIRPYDLARLQAGEPAIGGPAADRLRAGLRVSATAGGTTHACAPTRATLTTEPPTPASPEPMWLLVARFACGPNAGTLHLRYDLFFDLDPYHESYTRLALGEDAVEDAASASTVVFHNLLHEIPVDVRRPPPLWQSALLYLRLGVAHILTGYDHLAFLLALLLGAGLTARTRGDHVATAAAPRQAIRSTIAVISAFTVAHSITLITQVLRPNWVAARWVEPAIAFSVAIVALENLLPRPPANRWPIVFGFGLVHGLGFASVLREIGLPRHGLLLSLLSFNLGVELGQLLVVALVLPLIVAAARRAPRRFERWALQLGSAVIAVFGGLWLILRLTARG